MASLALRFKHDDDLSANAVVVAPNVNKAGYDGGTATIGLRSPRPAPIVLQREEALKPPKPARRAVNLLDAQCQDKKALCQPGQRIKKVSRPRSADRLAD
jgi:hypothetical protein